MIRIILIAWTVLSSPAAFICWCVCRDEEKRCKQ